MMLMEVNILKGLDNSCSYAGFDTINYYQESYVSTHRRLLGHMHRSSVVFVICSPQVTSMGTQKVEINEFSMGTTSSLLTVGTRFKKGVLHIVSNSVVPGTDVTSDFLTFLELVKHGDIKWAIAVLVFMFLPFFFKMAEFVVDLYRGKVKENNVVGLFLHLPFVAPIVHLSLGLRILLIDPTKPENLSSIEKVAKVAALGSMYEAFLESGPQLQLQLHIILSTGRPSVTQVASVVLSTLSLTLASCRAFYVQRSQELTDPEPNIHMILRVFPYMLIQVHIMRIKICHLVILHMFFPIRCYQLPWSGP